MTNNIIPISQLPAATTLTLSDLVPVVNNGITKKSTVEQLIDIANINSICALATTTNLTATYDNGSFGIGATLTNSGSLAALTIDGVLTQSDMRILVKNQSSPIQNGVYTVTVVGDGSTAWKLTRALDYNAVAFIEAGDFFTITFGTVNAKTQWIETSVVTEVGVDNITFESNIVAGSGIIKTNNILSASTFPVTGTFTPVLSFGGLSTGIAYSQQLGEYSQIGNVVYVRVFIRLVSKGSSTGAAVISGLPFNPVDNDSFTNVSYSEFLNYSTGIPMVDFVSNGTCAAYNMRSGLGIFTMVETNFEDNTAYAFSGFYFTS